jgi:hypothetical protein
METYTGGATGDGTGQADLPELPALQDLVDEITARNAELAALTGIQTEVMVEIGTEQLTVQEEILQVVKQIVGPIYSDTNDGGNGGPATNGANANTSLWTTVQMP